MKVLIVADVYPPEVSSGSHLMKELAEGLFKNGHKVTVVTVYPRHYLTKNTKSKVFETFSDEEGIKVIRVKTLPLRKVNFIIRGISQLLLPFLIFSKIKSYVTEKPDSIIVYSPPLPLALAGIMAKRKFRSKLLLNIQDIFPQNAIDLGILKNKLLIKFFEWMESYIYSRADVITFNSDGGREFLIEKKKVPREKIFTLYNWVDVSEYEGGDPSFFRKKYGIEDKFIFLFGGIFGPAQGMEFLINVAEKVSDLKNVLFLLVGDGTERKNIERMIKEKRISNVRLESFVSKEEFPLLVKSADVGVVCLSSANKTSFIPGKFLGYLASSKPVIAFLNKESGGFSLVEKAECGYAVRSDNLKDAELTIRKMYKETERLSVLGKNGKKYAIKNLSLEVCIKKIESSLA